MFISKHSSHRLKLYHAALAYSLGILGLALTSTSSASAQAVALSGILGDKALLVIDGAPPSLLTVGNSKAGVKLLQLDAQAQQITVEAAGEQRKLRVCDSPVSVGSKNGQGGGRFITIPMGSGGHFFTKGFVNGRSIQFMVDTGASSIAIGQADAERLGIDYKKQGSPVQMGTANGVVTGQRVTLKSLRIGEVEVSNIDAIVGPNMPFALLGNNFLSRFKMERNNDLMRLERTR